MSSFADLLAQGGATPWFYLPLALGLGALHALEPGHAKSMMAGFVVATRGTPGEAALLGLSAAVAHSLTVWIVVLVGLWLGRDVVPEAIMPWLGIVAGGIALGVAAWMAWRLRDADRHHHHHGHRHHHRDHDHDHDHDDSNRRDGHHAAPALAGGRPTHAQIVTFGFSGGLMPCPAALVVLMLCLNTGAFGLGVAIVAAFSAGLALVLVGVGVTAAFGMRTAIRHVPGMDALARRAPWLSVAIIAATGCWTIGHAAARLM